MQKRVKNIWAYVFVAVLALPATALAQDPTGILEVSKDDVTTGGIVNIIFSLAEWILILLGVIAVIIALWSAFQFIAGGTNEDQIRKAKNTLVWALVGVAVAILSFSIVRFVQSLLNA